MPNRDSDFVVDLHREYSRTRRALHRQVERSVDAFYAPEKALDEEELEKSQEELRGQVSELEAELGDLRRRAEALGPFGVAPGELAQKKVRIEAKKKERRREDRSESTRAAVEDDEDLTSAVQTVYRRVFSRPDDKF